MLHRLFRRAPLFLVIASLCTTGLRAQNLDNFNHLSVNEGLSQSTIFAIQQDSKGFMWFGTRGGGVNKYDGYDFDVYRNIPGKSGCLSDNVVISLLEDSQGLLWVGTRNGGINLFDLARGQFRTFSLEAGSEVYREASLAVRCIFEDRSGRLWIGTNHRVYLYDREGGHFDPMLEDAPFPVKGTTGICEDSSGYIYFATWDRLIRYHPEKHLYDELPFAPDPFADFGGRLSPLLMDHQMRLWLGTPNGLKMIDTRQGFNFSPLPWPDVDWPASFSEIRCMMETRDSSIWFGTKDGLYAIDPGSGRLRTYKTNPVNPNSLAHNSVYSLFQDRVGSIWVGTWSGISILDRRKYEFVHYAHLHKDSRSLSNNIVSSFQEDERGMWIGTEQGGLNFMDHERTSFTAYQYDKDDPASLPTNNVKTVFLDSKKNLWVGTFIGGLSKHLGGGRFENFMENHSIYSIIEQPAGKLWFGGRTGLYTMDLESQEIFREVFPPASGLRKLEDFIMVLYTDTKNRIWIGTRNEGLYLFDPLRESLHRFHTESQDTTSISGDYILSICEDGKGQLWVGTYNGLNRFEEGTQTFTRISPRLDIDDYVINGLLSDYENRLWISTNTGLYNYDPSNGDLRHYDHLDGLQSTEFNRGSCYKNQSGEMFFGGVNGFNVFHPDDIRRNQDAPPVLISDLRLFNKSVIPGEKGAPLSRHITETDKIVLSHRQSSFSFEFEALNYLIPEKNSYAYKLEGYDEDWNYCGRSRTASYMNLDRGAYTFRVKGSNNDNIWNETGASIDVRVRGPYWSTPLAIFLYIVGLIALLFLLIRIVRFRAEKENELALERAEKNRMNDENLARLQFFTNISHEFRTPLTLIAGALDKLISGREPNQASYFQGLMKSNVNRMLRLVNQLMDFRKLDNEKMILRVRPGNLDEFLGQIVLGFEDLADSKMIELLYHPPLTQDSADAQFFDEGIIDKVVYNLLSNAFKFTPEHGVIEVSLHFEEQHARIEVKDSGKGIDPDKAKRIFERYYSENPEIYTGTGIGLSLSKRLIDLHRGTIQVESEKGHGATFMVSLPVARSAFNPEEIISEKADLIYERLGLDSPGPGQSISQAGVHPGNPDSGTVILIAEDNPEMSAFLADHFSIYKVILASNGREALELAKSAIPDLILSDVMMPEMDGIEFCREVKKEFLTSHIPVILLTAKAAVDEKIEGLETGADAYIEKPFDADYLTAMVNNLLVQRRKLIQKFTGLNGESTRAADPGARSSDDVFLGKVNSIVTEHISDPDFTLDQLLTQLGMSRSQLYRKFKAISERNPSEYIRILRLQHAARMIREGKHTVSEVAYMSGFSNISYFNTCFKRHFGEPPGKYLKNKSL